MRAAAQEHAFDLVQWEVSQLQERLPYLLHDLRKSPEPNATALLAPGDADVVRQFFDQVDAWRAARDTGVGADALAALRAAWEADRGSAAAVIAGALNAQAISLGLTTNSPLGDLLLPPASFDVTAPPRVLVVSRRDRVEVTQSVLLRPDLTTAQAEALEAYVDGLGLSGLVITVGGIATYPAIVPLQGSAADTLSAVAHEWLHGYLFFRPLGQAYFTSYDGRMLNETVADLGGRELGRVLGEALGLPARATLPAPRTEQASGFDFRREMRTTRQQLDALLGEGRVADAEQYLETRRQEFVAAGYPLRKLNQAYFAFNGSYGESPASASPLDRQVRALRAASPDLGSFLRRVSEMTSPAEVAAAVGEAD